jgi:hypothetical protein
LNFGRIILEQGKAPGVVFKHTLEHFTIEELSDAMIVIGYYRLLSIFIKPLTFRLMRKRMATGLKGKRKSAK